MKKHWIKKVKVCGYLVEVTDATPEVYRITLVYADGYEEVFYRSFYDVDAAERYCVAKLGETNNAVSCYFEYSVLGTWLAKGGNEDE